MGRGWVEEKQIGEALQREGSTERGGVRGGREWEGKERWEGSERREAGWGKGLECRRNLGNEEGLKAGGEEKREIGMQWKRRLGRESEENPRSSRRRKEEAKASVRRGGGLREGRPGPAGERSSF